MDVSHGTVMRKQRTASVVTSAQADHRPRVSIVVGSYNRLTSLCELLQRFLEQDFRDFEIVVIEQSTNVSEVERRRLLDIATDARIRIYQRPPLGGAGARNEG